MCRPKQIMAQSQISIPEDEYEEQLPPSKCAKILYYTWKFCSCIFTHFIMITTVIAYCILGAFTFSKLESENEKMVKQSIIKIRENITEAIWMITEESLVLHEGNWTTSVKGKLKTFEDDILNAMKRRGWDGNDNVAVQQWTFTGALFYSIIVITTIGYGHIAPKTQWGKVVTIFYAILGIPLMLLCLSNIGDVMASSFRFIYWRVCCFVCTRKPKKKHRQKSLSRQGSRSVRGRTQSVRRRARAVSPRAHSDTDCRYKDDSYVTPTASRGAGGARGRNLDRRPLRSQSHTPGAHLEVPNSGIRDLQRSPSNRSPTRHNAYGDRAGNKESRLAIPLNDINDDKYGLNPPRKGRARPGDLRSRSLPRPQREDLTPAGKRFFSDKSYPKPDPRKYERNYHPQRQGDYDLRDNDVFRSRTERMDTVKHDDIRSVDKRDMFDRYARSGRGRRIDRVVSMDSEYYDYDREDDDLAYERSRERRAASQYDYGDMEYDDEGFEPRRRYGRYPKYHLRDHHDHSPDRIPGLDDYDMGQWRSKGPPRREDPVDEEWQYGNRSPPAERFIRAPRTDDIPRGRLLPRDDHLPRGCRLPRADRFQRPDFDDDDFEEGMPQVVDCWSEDEDEDIEDFVRPDGARRPPRAMKPPASPRMMTPLGLRVYRQPPTRSDQPPPTATATASHNGTVSEYPATYNKEQIKPVPIWLCVFLVVSYIIAGAFLFKNWEKWSLLDSAYFCFITLTTIGFGDFVPAQTESNSELRIALCSLYLLFGISLLAMSFNLVQEEVIANIRSVAKRLGIIKPEYGEESDDE